MVTEKKNDSCLLRKNCFLERGYAAISVSTVLNSVPTTVYHTVL